MLKTEEEARQLWCPFARSEWAYNDPSNGIFVSANRGRLDDPCRCIAEGCMAWRDLGATRLDEADHVRAALIEATAVAGATLLHLHVHRFTPSGGLSGVAVLAESHISIHTWPEHGYAAIDVFMCGQTEPHKSIDVLRRAFEAETIEVDELRRGKLE